MSSTKIVSSYKNLEVIYEDNHLIAVNKKPSDIVQGDSTGDKPLSEVVKEYLKVKYNKPGEVYLGVIHRIDRPVSGVVLFAKTSKALSRMNELFKTKKVQKTYLACVKNPPPDKEAVLVNWLYKDAKKNKSFVGREGSASAKRSELQYRVLDASDNYFLLEVSPATGRHHQIRVQLANMKSPIKGDLKYGYDRSNKNASIHLHARTVEFEHPVKKELIRITAPLPSDDPVWNYFQKKLA